MFTVIINITISFLFLKIEIFLDKVILISL
jgi:hypothetical protein